MNHNNFFSNSDTNLNKSHIQNNDDLWNLILWDDHVNLTIYIEYVLYYNFKFSKEALKIIINIITSKGKAIIFTDTHQKISNCVEKMQDYGIIATMSKANSREN